MTRFLEFDDYLWNQQSVLGTLYLLYVISLVGPADCDLGL
jgi:hypothetical protein